MNIDGLIHINVFQFIYKQSNSDRVDWVGVISLSMESRDMCCQWPFGFELLSTCFAWYHVLDIRMSVTKRTHWTVNKMCDWNWWLLISYWTLPWCHMSTLRSNWCECTTAHFTFQTLIRIRIIPWCSWKGSTTKEKDKFLSLNQIRL